MTGSKRRAGDGEDDSVIYLDNAATSFPKPRCTVEAMTRALEDCGANPGRAGHALSLAAGRIVENCREQIAQMIGEEDATRIAFTQNTTQALNTAIHGTLRRGDHAVTTLIEHNSVLRPLSELARAGFITLTIVPPEPGGRVNMSALERAITRKTRLVAVTHMSNVLGSAQDLAAVGAMCRRRGALFLADCAQTAGHLPLTPKVWGCHMLAMPGHKGLLGPHGTGALWVAPGVEVSALMQGGTGSASESMMQPAMMPDRLESGTLNLPGIAGLAAGMKFAMEHMQEAHEGIQAMCERLHGELLNIKGVMVYTPEGASLVTFNIEGMGSQEAAAALNEAGIAVRGGLHCAPGTHRWLGTLEGGAVRVSPGIMNSMRDVDALAQAVAKMVK